MSVDTADTYQVLMRAAKTHLDRVQIAVSLNHDYISARCDQYHRDALAWKWRWV